MHWCRKWSHSGLEVKRNSSWLAFLLLACSESLWPFRNLFLLSPWGVKCVRNCLAAELVLVFALEKGATLPPQVVNHLGKIYCPVSRELLHREVDCHDGPSLPHAIGTVD